MGKEISPLGRWCGREMEKAIEEFAVEMRGDRGKEAD